MAMSAVALVLGPVVFQDFEIPDRIAFGGDQRLAVHDLPGGERVIDALGPTAADISWSGTFSGTDATLRARTLDVLRVQGTLLTLSWDVFFYNVVIRSFEAAYHNTAWVPYRLRVSVVLDTAQAVPGAVATLVSDAIGDVEAAANFASLAGVDLGDLQTAIAQPGATVLQTGAAVAATTALAAAQGMVQAVLNTANASLAGYALGLANGAAVGGMVVQAGNAAALSATNAYLGRLSTNMQNASS